MITSKLDLLDRNAFVDLTEDLKDKQTGILNEIIDAGGEKEIDSKYNLTGTELLLCPVKVEIDVETFDEFGDRISIVVRLGLNQPDQFFHVDSPLPVGDDGRGQVAENVRTRGVNRIQVGIVLALFVVETFRVEKEINEKVTAMFNVEVDEEAPVDEPGSILQCLNRTHVGILDEILQRLKIFIGFFPVLGED